MGAIEDLHGIAGGLLLPGLGVAILRVQPQILRPARLAEASPARDPLAVPAAELMDVRVLATLVGGELVHHDPALGWAR
jgi:hypothetical protein